MTTTRHIHKTQAETTTMTRPAFRYKATGGVAHDRISPLLPVDWVDNEIDGENEVPDFLWENAQKRDTQSYRDSVSVYSHLPNGSNILDSKWVLGRLFSEPREDDDPQLLATLETHCFRGAAGFQDFRQQVNLFDEHQSTEKPSMILPDILKDAPTTEATEPVNLWVVKDAHANGAGGIWVVGPGNAKEFACDKSKLFPKHRYVAQKYVWPPVLFGGRKCHVRVYGLFTADGRAFVHHRAFLHVANDPFTSSSSSEFQDSVHITNCCANSDDETKFAGEIQADFEQIIETERDGQRVIPLGDYFPSIRACVSSMAKRAFPFLQGGNANHGFEYLGMDFILSHNEKGKPVAYMLEINCPPSQDTATGLAHAENLHDQVMRDLISLWVLPNVPGTNAVESPGGWRCVHQMPQESSSSEERELIVPSKAAIISKIRWAIFERKAQKKEQQKEKPQVQEESEEVEGTTGHCNSQVISKFARSQFPYFVCSAAMNDAQVFFENAGGSQVAQTVVDAMMASLSFRHREVVGTKTKQAARETFQRILGARRNDPIILGPNASSLLSSLADLYVQLGLLTEMDEVIISTESHVANVIPWEQAAKAVGATIRWWTPFCKKKGTNSSSSSPRLEDLLSSKTRIVAIPHASNILGQIRDIESLTRLIKLGSDGRAHVVVDGVAAAPHWFPDVETLQADWYVVSGHKIFGPHLGGLYGRRGGAVELFSDAAGSSSCSGDECVFQLLECGTVNYEGCAGIVGLGKYFSFLAASRNEVKSADDFRPTGVSQSGEACSESEDACVGPGRRLDVTKQTLTADQACEAYACIRIAEEPILQSLLDGLRRFPKVRIIEGDEEKLPSIARLPIVSLVHEDIKARMIYNACEKGGISCRVSSFLCTEHMAQDFDYDQSEGILRVSLAHYNTVQEVSSFLQILKSIPGWN
jgi:selenocysteine lyase/cysteine desulfurase